MYILKNNSITIGGKKKQLNLSNEVENNKQTNKIKICVLHSFKHHIKNFVLTNLIDLNLKTIFTVALILKVSQLIFRYIKTIYLEN